jgi:hypothetical protein
MRQCARSIGLQVHLEVQILTGVPSWVRFCTHRCTGHAGAARVGALRAWEMHLQVPNDTQETLPVTR